MTAILAKSASFLFVIFLGILLKQIGLFGKEDYRVLSKVVLNLTLPAAVITSTASMTWQPSLILVPILAFAMNWLMIGVGSLLARGCPRQEQVMYMVNCPSWNVGAFALPFVQSFLGPGAVMGACLFDMGNSVMCTGGTYAFVSGVCGSGEEKLGVKGIAKKLLTSVPFVTYMTMMILMVAGIAIPQGVVDFVSPIAAANPFVAMLTVGAMFRFEAKPAYLRSIGKVLGVRIAAAVILSALCLRFAPFSLEVRQGLAVMVFAPISVIAPMFTEKCGGDPGLAGCVNSLSILTGVVGMLSMILLLGVA